MKKLCFLLPITLLISACSAADSTDKIYHQIYGSDENIYKICFDDRVPVGRTMELGENKSSLICKCVVKLNREMFVYAVTQLKPTKEGIENLINAPDDLKNKMINMNQILCSDYMDDYGKIEFEKTFSDIKIKGID